MSGEEDRRAEEDRIVNDVGRELEELRRTMLDRLGPGAFSDEGEVEIGYRTDPVTGETIVAIHDVEEGLTWSLVGSRLIAQRERAGRVEYSEVSEQGRWAPWKAQGPPPQTAQSN